MLQLEAVKTPSVHLSPVACATLPNQLHIFMHGRLGLQRTVKQPYFEEGRKTRL